MQTKSDFLSMVSVGLTESETTVLRIMSDMVIKTRKIALHYHQLTVQELESQLNAGHHFDLILVDLDRSDTHCLWYTLKALYADDSVLVAISARPESQQASHVLSKPFEYQKVLNLIESLSALA